MMRWGVVEVVVEGVTSFLLFHEFRRLLKVAALCRRNDIKCSQSITLAAITISLSGIFIVFFISGLGALLNVADSPSLVAGNQEDGRIFRRVYVEKVLDGDTVQLSTGERVVYKGIDSPEPGGGAGWLSECSSAAKELNRRLVEGKRVTLEMEKAQRDKYNRIVAYVHVDDVFVNAELTSRGLAMAVIYRPEDRYNLLLSRLQEEAKSFNRGIWKYAVSAEDELEKTIVWNRMTKIYHLPEDRYYDLINPLNKVYFVTEEAAGSAGYRRAKY